jgi:arylsulfatase A-like enzyme
VIRAIALGLLVVLVAGGCAEDPGPAPRGILVVCVDTLRSDRVGSLGSGRDTSPEIDRLAARGVRFTSAIAPAPFTAPSVASVLTGVSPLVHGVRSWREFGRRYRGPTTPRILHAFGWRTGFLGANGFLHAIHPVRTGFDDFEDIRDRPAPALTRRALRWLDDARKGGEPWFLWVHYFDPHAPYEHHEEHGDRFVPRALREGWGPARRAAVREAGPSGPDWAAAVRLHEGLYDGEVAFADAAVGDLLRGLEERGLAATTHVVLIADHGENLGDHAPHFTHRDALWDSLIRVPLIVAGPDVRRDAEVPGLVATRDLAATILDLAGVDRAPGLGGRSFAPALRGEAWTPEEVVFSDAGQQKVRLLSARTAERKLLRHGETTFRWSRLDLRADPGETRELEAGEDDPLAGRLADWVAVQRKLHAEWNGPDDGRRDSWSPEELRHLRAFGYLR